MARDVITTAAFLPVDPAGSLIESLYGLTFPPQWREVILDLYKRNRPNLEAKTYVPIRRLNQAIAALAPDLVSVASRAALDDTLPWVYTTKPYDVSTMKSFVLAWLRDLRPADGDYPIVREAMQRLETEGLEWDLYSVDLLAHEISPGGTVAPEQRLFRLLPDVIAERIENLPPFEYNGDKVRFRQAATDQGAELISWPPQRYPLGTGAKPWRYSAVVSITLQTVPFDPRPRLHIGVSIRRWVRGHLDIPSRRGVSAYLLADSPWITNTTQSPRFARAIIEWNGRLQQAAWRAPKPALLKRLSMATDFPEAYALAKAADELIPEPDQLGVQGVQAALTYHTTMEGKHKVRPGIMPDERRRVLEWVASALEPDFVRAPDLTRIRLGNPERVLKGHRPIPAKDDEDSQKKKAVVQAANKDIDADNAAHNRQLVLDVCGDRLNVHILYQTEACRDELVRAAEDHLGLHDNRVTAGDDRWTCATDELTVAITATRFDLAGPLGGEKPPRTADAVRQTTAQRRAEVRQLCESLGDNSTLVLVEIEEREVFKPRTCDPKFAIRLGCADAGRVTQFITIDRPDDNDDSDDDDSAGDLPHRADAAWRDGMRQLGARFIPKHSLGANIPQDLNQIAFWLIKRQADSTKLGPQYTPIAILARPNQNTLLGRTSDSDGWIPYRQLLLDLVGRARPDDLKTAAQQQAEAARFMHKVLYGLRNTQTLVMVDAHNSRYRVPWLQDKVMIPEMLQLGAGPVQRLSLYGRGLRMVRVRGDDRHETAEWWAPKDGEPAGFSKGLWRPGGTNRDGRVYYSTMERSGKHQVVLNAVKLTSRTAVTTETNKETGEKHRASRQVCDSSKSPWNPTLLEICVMGVPDGESPEAWAAFVHQQRLPDENSEGLALPLLLHLARKAGDYALPHQDDEALITTDEDADTELTHESDSDE